MNLQIQKANSLGIQMGCGIMVWVIGDQKRPSRDQLEKSLILCAYKLFFGLILRGGIRKIIVLVLVLIYTIVYS
jgi:hypothetical protein